MDQQQIFDLIIIGAGPAGMTASIYASRYKLTNVVIGKVLAGELSLAHKVCNLPGFIAISGIELGEKWKEQVESLGGKMLLKEVGKIEMSKSSLRSPAQKFFSSLAKPSRVKTQTNRTRNRLNLPYSQRRDAVNAKKENFWQVPRELFKVFTGDREVYQSKALIVATGSERRRLNIAGEKEFLGRGVSYCYTCDAPFFKNKTVIVVGGSDSAVSAGVHLAEHSSKVYIVYRGDQLRAEPFWLEEWKKVEAGGKGETIYKTNLIKIIGDSLVKAIELDRPYKGKNTLETNGVFVEIGGVPGTSLIQPLGAELDQTGHVKVNLQMETNIPGLFCAGDMIDKSATFKQAIWAMGQGAVAAANAYKFIKQESAPQIKGV